jgi:GntR family transcriptional regulator
MNHAAPIYVQIQAFLRKSIEQGRFRPQERLPSEQDLASRFGTTRATVAKALQQLVFEGLISRRVGSGTFVSSPSLDDRVDTTLLESFEDHVLATGESLQYELLTFAAQPVPAELALRMGQKEPSLWRLERLRYVGGRKVALELRYMPEAIACGIDPEWLRVRSVQQVLREDLGLLIGRIDNAISATVATSEQAILLQTPKGSPLLVREHTIFGPKDRILLHGSTCYCGKFSVRYTLEPSSVGARASGL